MTEYLQPYEQMPPPRWQQRGDGLTILAGYHFLVAALFLLGTLVLLLPTAVLGIVGMVDDPDAFFGMIAVGVAAVVTLILSLLYIVVGFGLWNLRQWARVTAIALAVVSLVGIPIGTIAGALTLWHLLRSDVAAKFE